MKRTASSSLSHPAEGEPAACAVSTRLLGSADLMRSAQRKINRALFCRLLLVCGFAPEQGGFPLRKVTRVKVLLELLGFGMDLAMIKESGLPCR